MSVVIRTLIVGTNRDGPQGPTGAAGPSVASGITYDPTTSGLVAVTAQAAIDELAAVAPVADATTARALAIADRRGVYFTSTDPIVVTAPTLPAGTVIPLVQRGAGQFTITGDGVTLAIDGNGDYLAKSAAAESVVVLWYLTATLVSVTGSLEASP